jgi:hypothetical protein
MKTLFSTGFALLLLSCGGPMPQQNPKELWIALNGSEKALQLVPMQPAPF